MTSLAFLISGVFYLGICLLLCLVAYVCPEIVSLRGTLFGAGYGSIMMLGAWMLTSGVLEKRKSSMLHSIFIVKVPLLIFFLLIASQDGEQGLIAFVLSSLAALPASMCGAIFSQRLR